jgi:hypothetical protein
VSLLIAQAAAEALNPVSVISAVGFPIFTFLAIGWYLTTGKYHSASEVDGLRADKIVAQDERRRLELQVDALTQQFVEVILPTVHQAVGTFGGISKILEQTVATNTETRAAVVRLEQAMELNKRVREAKGQ